LHPTASTQVPGLRNGVGKRGRGEVLVEPPPLGKSVLVVNKDCSQSTLRAQPSSSHAHTSASSPTVFDPASPALFFTRTRVPTSHERQSIFQDWGSDAGPVVRGLHGQWSKNILGTRYFHSSPIRSKGCSFSVMHYQNPLRRDRDNVPVFSYLLNGDHFSRPSVIKRSNRRRFCLGMTHTIERNMPHWTPKNPPIVLKIRPIPPSAHGVSFTIWQLCHCLSTGCATVLLPPGDRINREANRRGMMGRNWVCFRTFDLRI